MLALGLAALAAPAATPHILILPFATPPAQAAKYGWMGESVSEAIRESFANAGLLVVSRAERLNVYRRLSLREGVPLTRATMLKVAQTVDVDYVIHGTVEPLADSGRLEVRARTLKVRELSQGPETSAAGPAAELSVLQQQVVWELLRALSPALAVDDPRRRPVVRLEALEQYVHGLLAAKPDVKYKHLLQAAHADDRFGPARFELGKLQFERNNYSEAIGWLERVPSTDALHNQARFLAGIAYFQLTDFQGAERSFELVERNLPLAEVHNNLGAALARQGRLEEALRHFDQACQADSRETAFRFNRGYALWRLKRYAPAAEEFKKVLERAPEDPEGALFLHASEQPDPPAQAELQFANRERLQLELQESAYRQLKALLDKSGK